MGRILHGCATTAEAVRCAIQHSQESLRTLARRHGVNQKTVAKWRSRNSVTGLPAGPSRQACEASPGPSKMRLQALPRWSRIIRRAVSPSPVSMAL